MAVVGCGWIALSSVPMADEPKMTLYPIDRSNTAAAERNVSDGDIQRFPVVGRIPAPKAMAADIADNNLYFVGANTLWVADLMRPSAPAVVGIARFDGDGRQIAVKNGVAYVTATGRFRPRQCSTDPILLIPFAGIRFQTIFTRPPRQR